MRKSKQKNKLLNSLDILMISFGAMIGWGWVVSSGNWIQQAGVFGTVFGFIIGGVMIYFVGLVYAELSTAMPEGGCLSFTRKAFGPVGSFITTWIMILGYVGVVCFESCSLPTIVAYIFPGFLQGYLYSVAGFDIYATWLITALAFAILIIIINIKGIKSAAIFQNILTIIIAVVGIILIISSSIKGDSSNLTGQLFNGQSGAIKFKNVLAIATVAPFFLFGFDVIPQTMSDVKVNLKKTGRILLLSIILAVGFYALVTFAIGYSMNSNEINQSVAGSGLTAADAMSKIFNSQAMAKVLIFGGLCGVVTSWNSFLIGGSRTITSLSDSNMISPIFSKKIGKSNTPINSILLIGFLSLLAPFFGRSMLVWIANTSSFACCLAYFLVSISFIVLRKKDKNMIRPYKIKFGLIVGATASILSLLMVLMYLIPNSGSTLNRYEIMIALVWMLLGFVFLCNSKEKYGSSFGIKIGRNL